MLSTQEKTKFLRDEFNKMDLNSDQKLTKDELFQCLDQKVQSLGGQFDRNVGDQLFEQMDKNYDQSVTPDEFIKVFLLAEETLLSKIENTKKYLQDFHRQQAEAKRKLQEAQQTERTNQFGIMENSILKIEIKEAQLNQQPNNGSTLTCLVSVSEQVHHTRAAPLQKPQWNESFTFQIETGLETLNLQLVTSTQEPLGQLSLPLSSFQDQTVHSELLQLRGQYICGLSLQAQWIHSRKKFLQDVVEKWDEQIKVAEEDQRDFEQDLEIIYQPFGGMMSVYNNQLKGMQAPSQQQQQLNAGFKLSGGQFSNENDNGLLPIAKKFFDPTMDSMFFLKITLVVIIFLSFLLFFYKFAIIDLILCIVTIEFIYQGQLIPGGKPFYAVMGAFGISILYELFYMILVAPGIWKYSLYGAINPEEGISKFIVIFTYFVFFTKIGVLILLILIFMSNRQKQNAQISPEQHQQQPQDYNYQPMNQQINF